jgi:hypothetical protein
MNSKITLTQIEKTLQQTNQPYTVLPLQNKVSIVISQLGGRIFGPYLSPNSESIFWTNKALADPDSFKEFLTSGDWNLGGERTWIAPETQYLVKDRSDFWGSIEVPAAMDPGDFSLTESGPGQWKISMDTTLQAYNFATGQKQLHVEKVINQVEDPLRGLRDYETLVDGVIFAGYEQVVTLSESDHDDIMSETWNLIQLNAGGQLIIPASPYLEYTDYFEPIDGEHQTINDNHVRLNITGQRRYKVGYKAAHTFGRLAYFNHLDDNQAYLIVRNFFNNPAVPYAEEPSHTPGERGHSIHVYNDGWMFGGFGELEVNGQTIGGETGKSSITDQFVLWLYVGSPDKIKKLAAHLLGVAL